jgi:hypothetical protein
MKTQEDFDWDPTCRAVLVRVRHQDFQRAIEFYSDLLGCCVYADSSVIGESNGFRIRLMRDDVRGDPVLLRSTLRRGPFAEFVVEDFDERVRDLAAAGCQFSRSPVAGEAPLRFVQVTDPFEHLWMLRRFEEHRHADMKFGR